MTRERSPHDRAVQRAARKEAKDPGHSVPRGPSLLSRLESDLLVHTKRYLTMKAIMFGEEDSESHSIGVERGIVRGLAMAVARVRYPYENGKVPSVEREFVRRAKDSRD
jgi:hypothetical protein